MLGYDLVSKVVVDVKVRARVASVCPFCCAGIRLASPMTFLFEEVVVLSTIVRRAPSWCGQRPRRYLATLFLVLRPENMKVSYWTI